MRGERFNTLVGASIMQTPGGVQSELSKIDGEFTSMNVEITAAMQAQGSIVPAADSAQGVIAAVQHGIDIATGKAKPPPGNDLDTFYHTQWLPFFASWKKWYADSDGWLHNLMWNEAPTAESFQRKALTLRDNAKRAGFTFQTPMDIEGMSHFDPRKPGPLDEIETFLKYALIGGGVLGGIFAIAKIVEVAKSK